MRVNECFHAKDDSHGFHPTMAFNDVYDDHQYSDADPEDEGSSPELWLVVVLDVPRCSVC